MKKVATKTLSFMGKKVLSGFFAFRKAFPIKRQARNS